MNFIDLVGDQQITYKTLDQIGREQSTDKAGDRRNYLRHYESLFGSRQGEPITLLELGVQSGASIRMWADYFHHRDTQVVGIDNDPSTPRYPENCFCFKHRLFTFIGSQDDPEFLLPLVERFGGFDIIIDDTSHNGDASRTSFEILYPHVRPGGFYVVEDLHTGYFGWGAPFVDYAKHLADEVLWPGGPAFSHGHGDPRNHGNWETIQDGMSDFCKQTKSMLLLSSLIVFEKWPAGEVF